MSKRFTETGKWDKLWFRKLPPKYKCFWDFLCAKCSNIGVWDVDIETARHFVGAPLNLEEAKALLADQIEEIDGGRKWLLTGFVAFQYGELTPNNNFHRSLLAALDRLNEKEVSGADQEVSGAGGGLPVPLLRGIGIEKDKERNKDVEVGDGAEGVASVLAHFNQVCQKALSLTADRKALIVRRLNEGRTIEDLKKAITNFSKDDWPDRNKYMDLVYAIGVRNKIDNLDRWINFTGGSNGIGINKPGTAYIGARPVASKYAALADDGKDTDKPSHS